MFSFISQGFLDLLIFLATNFNGNFGLAIIAITFLIRLVLVPITLPSLKSQKKIKELQPQLDKLKKKHGKDKQVFAQKQLELYKQHNVNPAAGCLPQIVQIALFIIFYRVLINVLNGDQPPHISFLFLGLDLTQPDTTYILPILAGISQLFLGLMIAPGADTTAEKTLAAQTKSKKDDKQAEDMTQMAQQMQSQMLYIMPAFTFFIALRFPSGLALYWVVSTLFSLVQQYFVSGLGGLTPHLKKLGIIHSK